MVGNYDPNYLSSGFRANGYFDSWNLSTAELSKGDRLKVVKHQRAPLLDASSFPTGFKTYQFIFRPPIGIFNCLKPLAPGHEVKLTFERATSEAALLSEDKDNINPLEGKSIDIRNPYIKANYSSSQYLRDLVKNEHIQEYHYDELSVYQKNLPTGEKSIRLTNIIGGQTPNYIFAGIIPTNALNPDKNICLTEFAQCGVVEFSFTFNGQNINGFPLCAYNQTPIEVYENFLTVTNRKYNNNCMNSIGPFDFKLMHNIYGYKFSSQNTESGWIGINLKLAKEFQENHVIGKLRSRILKT